MCRLFGIKNYDLNKHHKLLENFCELARTGNVMAGDPPGHQDGWGLGYYRDGKAVLHKSGGSLTEEKDVFFSALAQAQSSPLVIAHLRKSAWAQTSTAEHAHPFLYNNALFAHNGTVRDYKSLLPAIHLPGIDLSRALDTEVFFLYALSFVNPETNLESAFGKAVENIRRHNTYSALNCLLTDGKKLIACRDYSAHPGYYTLYHASDGGSEIISSEPVSPQLQWRLLEKGELRSF